MKIYIKSSLAIPRFGSLLKRGLSFLFWSGCVIAPLSVAHGAPINHRSYFKAPTEIGCWKDVVADFGASRAAGSRQNERFQRAIDTVSQCDDGVGGILIVPRGRYNLSGIKLRSNVHLRIDQGAVFHPGRHANRGERSIFELATNWDNLIENVSIVGMGTGFTFDLRTGTNTEAAIQLGGVRNFKLSNFTVKDRGTNSSSIAFFINARRGKLNWARDGLVEKAHQTGADIGYGLVQVHALTHVLFDDISSEGGVALRLEPDTPRVRRAGRGGIKDLRARNVGCGDGQAAVMLVPHTIRNGSVIIDGIQADSCAFAARIEPGAIEVVGKEGRSRAQVAAIVASRLGTNAIEEIRSRNGGERFVVFIKPSYAEEAHRAFNVRAGRFSRVVLNDVVSQYGRRSQFKRNQDIFHSCQEQENICKPRLNSNELRGGSVAAIWNMANGSGPGHYTVKTQNVHTSGYPRRSRRFVTTRTEEVSCPDLGRTPVCERRDHVRAMQLNRAAFGGSSRDP